MAARIANAAAAALRRGQPITATQRAYMNAVKWSGDEVGKGKALPRWSGHVELVPELLSLPLGWRKPRTVFPSMTDPFHEELSNEQIAAVFGVMAASPRHMFLILTKRPDVASRWFQWASDWSDGPPDLLCQRKAWKLGVKLPLHLVKGTLKSYPWPLPNVWLGTSVEDTPNLQRVRWLVDCPAAARFISYEPALGPIDLTMIEELAPVPPYGPGVWLNCLTGHVIGPDDITDRRVHWVIVGGESGPAARPFDLAWARSTVEQCKAAGVPCFVKQLGARPYIMPAGSGRVYNLETEAAAAAIELEEILAGTSVLGPSDPKGADPNEWPEDLRVQQWPEVS
jgi:protein gp37